MHEIDNRIDLQREHLLERSVHETPGPDFWRRLHPMPGNAITRTAHAKLRHQTNIVTPAFIMPGQLIFVQRSAGARMGRGDESVFNADCPQKCVGSGQSSEFRGAGQHDSRVAKGEQPQRLADEAGLRVRLWKRAHMRLRLSSPARQLSAV